MAEPIGRGVAAIAADADTMTEAWIIFGTPSWAALLGWCEFHGIDPKQIPAGSRISRDECGRCIRYVRIVEDEHGKPKLDATAPWGFVTVPFVEQGEAPPLPYPDEVQALLAPAVTRA